MFTCWKWIETVEDGARVLVCDRRIAVDPAFAVGLIVMGVVLAAAIFIATTRTFLQERRESRKPRS